MLTEGIKRRLPKRLRRSLVMTRIAATARLTNGKGSADFCKSAISAALRTDRSMGRPVHVSIEPTNVCNLRCPVCETGDGTLGRRGGHMELDAFKHVVDTMEDHLNVLYFYFMGEPFLVRNAYDMIEHASRKHIWVDTCTNGEFIDARNLINSGIGRISFQIGGMTQETHEIYRVKGNLSKSLGNLEACVEEKRKRPDSKTHIKVGFIVMRHNEHEVDSFVRYAKEIGVDGYEIVHPCARNMEQANLYLTKDPDYWIYDRNAFSQGILRPTEVSNHYCEWLYFTTTIQVNGDVVPCCRDPRGQYVLGNIFNQDFTTEIWNGQAYRDFRHTVATNQSESEICSLCSGYTAPDVTRHETVTIPELADPTSRAQTQPQVVS